MKIRTLAFFAFAAMAALCISCKSNAPVAPGDIDWAIPTDNVSVGKAVNFADNTLDVKSRTWTFQDGTPATSTAASVAVTYATPGDKNVTLEVVFTNGATAKKEGKVTVVEAINGEITVSATTPKGCIRIGQEVTFSLDKKEGTITKYEWSFTGGTPATSTDATPKVKFNSRVREMVATCKISNDNGAKATIEKTYVVGNLPVNQVWPALGYDGISFEDTVIPNWICYHGGDVKGVFSVANAGACGTTHSLKVSVAPIVEACADTPEDVWADIFPRDSWGCNAPVLEKGKKYELSFWMKADNILVPEEYWDVQPPMGVGCVQVIGWLDDWMTDPVFGAAGENWGDTFGLTYEKCDNKCFYQDWWGDYMQLDGTNWTHVSVEFTPEDKGVNVYPYFRIYPYYDYLLLDEIEINLVEE